MEIKTFLILSPGIFHLFILFSLPATSAFLLTQHLQHLLVLMIHKPFLFSYTLQHPLLPLPSNAPLWVLLMNPYFPPFFQFIIHLTTLSNAPASAFFMSFSTYRFFFFLCRFRNLLQGDCTCYLPLELRQCEWVFSPSRVISLSYNTFTSPLPTSLFVPLPRLFILGIGFYTSPFPFIIVSYTFSFFRRC